MKPMSNETMSKIKFQIVLFLIVFMAFCVGHSLTKTVNKLAEVCDKVGVEYQTTTNFFGSVKILK